MTAAAITGYVEAATGNAVLGWAWAPGQPLARLAVELRLDGKLLAGTVADQLREDLARNGIGDGRHAFTLPVPEAMQARSAELRVSARLEDGTSADLGQAPVPEGTAERLDRIQRTLDTLVGSQRVLHRNLQAVMMRVVTPEPAPDTPDPAMTPLEERLGSLEVFLARLDLRMAAMAAAPPAKPVSAWRPVLAAGLAIIMCVAGAGVWRSIAG